MQLHLVDGTYELFRSYFGAPKVLAPDGVEVGAVRGLLRSLSALLRTPSVTHVGVAFDHVVESFRNDLFPGYKTSAGVPRELLDQFPLAEDASRALGLVTWPMVAFEADDAIGTAATALWGEVDRVVIASPDKDLAQLVRGERIVTWDRMRDVVLDEAGVVAKFGVAPASIPDLLALVGDTADGIPGVPRWGAKSAATVLARWRRIEDIPSDPSDWDVKVRGAASLAESLTAHRDVVGLYKTLATLRTDAPVPETLEDLRWRGARPEALDALCARLGDTRFRPPVA